MKYLKTTKFEFSESGKQPNPATLRLAHISDFHLGKPSGDDLPRDQALERWLECFAGEGVDVLAVTGDLVEEPGDRRRLADTKRLLDEAPFPYVCIPGNHDIAEPGEPGPFEELFGDFPRVERLGDLDLVLFDSMKGLPVADRSPKERQNASSIGFYSLVALNVGASCSATKGRKRRGRLVDISEEMSSLVVRDVELE
ncbi:MAG: metallophosphoesterase family protein [Persicimonas sp.]